MIIKWCLYLKMISSPEYHAMRSSGFIKLPSKRTLRDYTHLTKAATGIRPEVSAQLRKEPNLDEWQKYMAVEEDIVYNKHIKFVNLHRECHQSQWQK